MELNGDNGFRFGIVFREIKTDGEIIWINSGITLYCSSFTGHYATYISSDEYYSLSESLLNIKEQPILSFETMEGGLRFDFQYDITGNVNCKITGYNNDNILIVTAMIDYYTIEQFAKSIKNELVKVT